MFHYYMVEVFNIKWIVLNIIKKVLCYSSYYNDLYEEVLLIFNMLKIIKEMPYFIRPNNTFFQKFIFFQEVHFHLNPYFPYLSITLTTIKSFYKKTNSPIQNYLLSSMVFSIITL